MSRRWQPSSFGLFVAVLAGALTAPASGHPQSPPCIRSWQEVRYRNYAYDHVVHIGNGCRAKASCAVASDANPEWVRIIVLVAEQVEVVLRRGSPAREFTLRIECRLET